MTVKALKENNYAEEAERVFNENASGVWDFRDGYIYYKFPIFMKMYFCIIFQARTNIYSEN